jgi:quercetin dioxygenase-like cupin family protein
MQMSWLCLWLLAAVTAVAQSPVPSANFGYKNWSPDSSQWREDPDAPGTWSKMVTGSPETGHWIMYAKVDPGAWINWHWHSNPQTMFGVSGTMEYEIRPNQKFNFSAGSYVLTPGHALHNGRCISKEPCTFFIENLLPNDKHMTDATGNELHRR